MKTAKFIKEEEKIALEKVKHELEVSRATCRTLAFEKKAIEESLEKKNEYTYKLEQLRDQLMEELRRGKKGDEDHENDKGFKVAFRVEKAYKCEVDMLKEIINKNSPTCIDELREKLRQALETNEELKIIRDSNNQELINLEK